MPAHRASQFGTTHWTLVFAACREDQPQAREALEMLCGRYWQPLYNFVRYRGYTSEDAQDLTQAFFTRLLEKGDLPKARPARGRFRSFLLAALKNFLANEYHRSRALKRGGAATVVSLDVSPDDQLARIEPSTGETPDDQFNRDWALAIVERGLQQTHADYTARGQSALFERLSDLMVPKEREETYAAAAAELGLSEGALKVAVHRMRRRFRDHLRAEIAETVDADKIDDEIRYLMRAIARPCRVGNLLPPFR